MSGVLGVLLGAASGSTDAAATTAFLARTTGLDATHTNAYKALINGLVTDSVFTKLDALYMLATADSTTAKLNLVSTSYGLTAVNTPTFTADQGYQGNGSTSCLDPSFNPITATTPKFVQDSCSIFAWSNTSAQDPGGIIGQINNKCCVIPRYTDDNFYGSMCTASNNINVANVDAKGLYAANQSVALPREIFKNGSSVASDATASAAPQNLAISILALGASSFFWSGVGLAAGFGQSLSGTDHANLYARVHTYLQTIAGIA